MKSAHFDNQVGRLYYFDNFRAIAISLIVMGHCYGGWEREHFYEKNIANAVTGATALFVFISGFFLHRVFYEKMFTYREFLTKKLVAVGLPYVVLSAIFMVAHWLLRGTVPTHPALEGLPSSVIVVVNFLTGSHMIAYWYIPFIIAVFLINPIFYSYMKLKVEYQLALTFILLAGSSLLFWRPLHGMNPLHAVLYYAPFYLLGISCSQHENIFLNFIKRNTYTLIIMWMSVLLLMTQLGQSGNAHKLNPFSFEGFDFMVLQKVILIPLIASLLYRFTNFKIAALSFVANNSFPVFFLHGWVLELSDLLFGSMVRADGFLEVLLFFLCVFALSLALTVMAKKILGRYSRFVIGA